MQNSVGSRSEKYQDNGSIFRIFAGARGRWPKQVQNEVQTRPIDISGLAVLVASSDNESLQPK